jgi:hypothetical protein
MPRTLYLSFLVNLAFTIVLFSPRRLFPIKMLDSAAMPHLTSKGLYRID